METISRRQSFSEKGINVMSEKEKIIVFSSREICYQSSSFFANQMADAFEDLGFDVQVCEFDEHDDLDAVFQPLYGQKYRLLLDFNSTITRMVEEDGTPVLDKIDGPFFDYILDHPLFHYNCLNANLKNLNGIFLDEAQEAYASDIIVVDGGHFYTEHPVVQNLANRLRQSFEEKNWDIEVVEDPVARDVFSYIG